MPPLGRNAPCPCGSGRRYKNCHGASQAARRPPEAAGSPVARADRLRARLQDACGALLSHRAREHSSPFAPPGPARAPGRIPPRNEIPEAEANRIVREMLDRHYADWPDHPLPALDGQTPRQAVRSAEGKERVRTLIKSFEHAAARGPAGQAPDTARLRRELGLVD